MPYLRLVVNVQIPNETEFALQFSKFSSEALGKPEALFSVSIEYNKALTFGGSLDPAFSLSIISVGNLNPEANEKYSAAFSEFIQTKLNIPNDRGYIAFQDPGRAYIGFRGTTAAKLVT